MISVTIGDGRLSSMETGTALIRAMTYVMQRIESGKKVDLINMSYGEHSHWSNAGKIGEMIGEIVNKYGVVWAVSAGNAGPALCTVGTPPDIQTNTMIGVGAYVSPEMMTAMYSQRYVKDSRKCFSCSQIWKLRIFQPTTLMVNMLRYRILE